MQRTMLLVAMFVAFSSAAQTVQVTPASPTSSDSVVLRVSGAGGFIGAEVTRTGNHFRLEMQFCPILCPGTFDVPLGTLPGGTYTYDLFDGSSVVATGSFQVINLVPALSPAALVILSALLAIAGVVIMSRYNFL